MGTTDEGGLILVDAMNTYDPALATLQERGYRVWVRPVGEVDEGEEWLARKDVNELVASDPLRLLGLAAILETRGVNWQLAEDEPDLYDALRAEAYDT
ncbi:MAG TPA: hypothetical protein VN282_11060 [Pyrinomonadaceae bacterium]|nr:hypothetical protein [Pyrinomonadaceae bacterium]